MLNLVYTYHLVNKVVEVLNRKGKKDAPYGFLLPKVY